MLEHLPVPLADYLSSSELNVMLGESDRGSEM